MEIKEKLLCALKSQADKIKDRSYRGCGGYRTITYLKVDENSSIYLNSKSIQKLNTIFLQNVENVKLY